jgi:WD40 repeat protein
MTHLICAKTFCKLLKYGHLDFIYALAFSPDGYYALSGGGDSKIYLWDIEKGVPTLSFDVKDPIKSVAFSPDGQYILYGGAEWDL